MPDELDSLLNTVPPQAAATAGSWQAFPADLGSLNVPRSSMPQIKSEHRGALVQFLKGRGITHTQEEVAPHSLKPSQLEFSPAKVDKARGFDGPQRSILVSGDDHVIDGHHQWLAALHDAPTEPYPVIRLHAPAHQLLIEAARFPSSGVDEQSADGGTPAQPQQGGDELDALLAGVPTAPTRAPKKEAAPTPPRAPTLSSFQPADGVWSLDHAAQVQAYFQSTYGRALPVSAMGESKTHKRMGLDHSNSMDVGLNPDSPEGQSLTAYLREQNIPFLAFARAVPGQATAPHIHVGYPSHGLDSPAAGDDLDKLLQGVPPVDELDKLLADVPHADDPNDTSAPGWGNTWRYQPPPERVDPDEVVHVDAQRTTSSPAATALPQLPARPDPYTEQGRAERDARTTTAQQPDARTVLDLTLPRGFTDWSELSSNDVAKASVRQYAATHGILPGFTEEWLQAHGDKLSAYDLKTGEALDGANAIRPDTYDPQRRTVRVSAEMPHLLQLQHDYEAQRDFVDHAFDVVADDTHTAGEKALGAAAPVVHAGARALDYATRPLRAVDYAVWSGLRGNDSLQPIADAFMGREPNAEEQNPIANAVADSTTLARINPNLPGMAAAATDMLTSPSNALLPLGGEAVDALKGTRAAARVGEVVEGIGEAGRAERFASGGRMLNIEAAEAKPRVRFAREGEGITGRGYEVSRNTGRIFKDGAPTNHIMTPTGPVAAPLDELPHHPSYRPDADLAPEAPETLAAQVEAMRAGRRAVVNVTPDALTDVEQKVVVPKGMRSFGTPEGGRIIYNPEMVERAEVVRRMDDGTLGELMGHIEAKPEQPTHVVVARDPVTGAELQSSYVSSAEKAQEQAAAFAQQHPGAHIEIGGADLEQQVLHERVGASASAPPVKGRLRRAGETALDVAAVPRSLMTTADLSAPGRQGLILSVTEPSAAVHAMGRQLKSLVSQGSHDELMRWLVTHPDADLAEHAGLYSAMKEGTGMAGHEEAFMSRLAGRAPIVKQSERAYVAYLDSLRQDTFSKYARELERAGMSFETHPAEFKSIARFINSATGRGELPAALEKVAPVLNATMFAPRNLKGRFDVLNPLFYARMSPAARKIAVRKIAQFAGTLTAGITLAHLAGAKTTIDPADPDFGKVVVGNTHYDFTGGHRSLVRYVLQMSKGFAQMTQGEEVKRNQGLLTLTGRFLRQNAAPLPAYLADAATGKTVTGQDFDAKRDALRLVTPLVAQDLYEGWQDAGGRGLLKATPAVLGIGVQTYKSKQRQQPEEAAAPMQNRLAAPGHYQPLAPTGASGNEPPSNIAPERGRAVGSVIDSLPEQQQREFLQHLDQFQQVGALRPFMEAAQRVAEFAWEHMPGQPDDARAYQQAAEASRDLRLLAQEARTRPESFWGDALAGKYGRVLQAEAGRDYPYPENHFPWERDYRTTEPYNTVRQGVRVVSKAVLGRPIDLDTYADGATRDPRHRPGHRPGVSGARQ